MIRKNGKDVSNGQVIPFNIGGGDDFKLELRTNVRGYYRVDTEEEFMKRERSPEVERSKKLETVRRKRMLLFLGKTLI